MVGILVSFWEGLFSGAMLVSGSVFHLFLSAVSFQKHLALRFSPPLLRSSWGHRGRMDRGGSVGWVLLSLKDHKIWCAFSIKCEVDIFDWKSRLVPLGCWMSFCLVWKLWRGNCLAEPGCCCCCCCVAHLPCEKWASDQVMENESLPWYLQKYIHNFSYRIFSYLLKVYFE